MCEQAAGRDPAATTDVLSVREVVSYLRGHGLPVSERHTRRLLSHGQWPMTPTPTGRLGMTFADLVGIWPERGSRGWVR